MIVHHLGAFRAGLVATVAMLAIMGYRGWRLAQAEQVGGQVQLVRGFSVRCDEKKGGRCTNFSALVVYDVRGTTYQLWEPAGGANGYDRPVSEAALRLGDTVSVAFDPADPSDHYNGGWSVAPAFVLAVLTVGITLIVIGVKKQSARGAGLGRSHSRVDRPDDAPITLGLSGSSGSSIDAKDARP